MQRLVNYQTGLSATGTYCQVIAAPGQSTPPPGVLVARSSILAAATFQIVAGTGVTAGTVQPVILGSDGNYRAYGPLITLTAPGSNDVSLTTPVPGAAIQITGTITGGTVYLEVDAVLV